MSDLGTSFRTAFQMIVKRYGASSRTVAIAPRSAVFGMDDRLDGSVFDSLLDGEQLPMHSQAATDARY